VPPAPPVLTLPIAAVSRATPDALLVQVTTGDQPFRFDPGQAVLLGRAGQPLRKPYSIALAPRDAAERRQLEFLIGASEPDGPGLHLEGLAEGAFLDVEGPIGAFTLPPDAATAPTLFVAGGTGIAPLRSMLRALLASGPGPRPTLVYSARTVRHLAYFDEFEALAREGRLGLAPCLTREAPQAWPGHRGRVDRALLARHAAGGRARALVCGPPAFVEFVSRALAEVGVPEWHIGKEEW
jgi:aromatic O-demethylase, reductase subunit